MVELKKRLRRKDITDVDLFVLDGEGFVQMDERKQLDEYELPVDSSVLLLQARIPHVDSYLMVESIEWKRYLLDVE